MSLLDSLLFSGLLLANAFFVAAEFALVKVRGTQLKELEAQGSWLAGIARKVVSRLDAYISASQLGITLASLGLGWMIEGTIEPLVEGTLESIGLPSHEAAVGPLSLAVAPALAFTFVTTMHIVLGELVPKSLAIRAARTMALWTAAPLMAFYYLFYPAIAVLNLLSDAVLLLFGMRRADAEEQGHTEEELRHILTAGVAGGQFKRDERDLIENVLSLEDKPARRVMVPAPDIVYLSLRRPLNHNLRTVRRTGHTRYPLCEGDLTNVVGFIHVKDLYRIHEAGAAPPDLARIARKVPFLHESIPLDRLLRELQRNCVHIAMLIDEYGTVIGMVTLDNVLEELVGPILDEFDLGESPRIQPLPNGSWRVEGACPLDELARRCSVEMPETDAETVGGLIVDRLGRLAQSGDVVRVNGHVFTVLEADPTRIRTVTMEPESGIEPVLRPVDPGIDEEMTDEPGPPTRDGRNGQP